MASDFQRYKIAGVFSAMDADNHGFLEQADFEDLTRGGPRSEARRLARKTTPNWD